jgi:hypothetical protein
MKREIPILLTVICGLLITISFFAPGSNPSATPPIPASPWQAVNAELLEWAKILFAMAFLLGIANLFRINLKQIAAGHEDRPYKVVLLVVMTGFLIVGLAETHLADLPAPALRALVPARTVTFTDGSTAEGYLVERDQEEATYRTGPELLPRRIPLAAIAGETEPTLKLWIYNKLFNPLQSTMFSLLAFYVASAAFRAFRARSLEATLLLAAGCIVMLGQVPVGDALTGGWAGRTQAFLMSFVTKAGLRAIIIGATLGGLATGLRIVLGLERSYLSE